MPAGLLLTISFSAACGQAAVPRNAGRLEARWSGADSGRITARATSEWCSKQRFLEIRAMQGDTALALVLYPVDTVEADSYRVVPPERADSQPPSAGVALRVFASNAVQGYQGDSGVVVLERSASGTLSGTLQAWARSVVNGQLVTISGRLRDLAVVPQSRGCTTDSPGDSVDSVPEPPARDVD